MEDLEQLRVFIADSVERLFEESWSGPIAHHLPLTPKQTHRLSASELLQEEVSRDRDTILRCAANHEVWKVFTLR